MLLPVVSMLLVSVSLLLAGKAFRQLVPAFMRHEVAEPQKKVALPFKTLDDVPPPKAPRQPVDSGIKE